MSFLDVWGWVCAVVGGLFAIPQVLRLLRAHTSAGLSLVNWQLMLGSTVGWTLHGLDVHRMQIVLPNFVAAVCAVLIIRMIQKDRGGSLVTPWGLCLVVAVVPFGLGFWLGAGVFGVLNNIPQVIGAIAQLRDMWRSSDLAGVSFVYLLMTAVIQFMWMSWAAPVGEQAVLFASGMMAVIGTANVIYYGLRRVGWVHGPVKATV